MPAIETLVLAALTAVAVFAAYQALRPRVLIAFDNSGSVARNRPNLAQVRSGAGLRFFHKATVVVFNHAGVTEAHGAKLPDRDGGTDFEVLSRWVDANGEGFARIVVATDGYAPEVLPTDPQRWTWLLTETVTPPWLEHASAQVRHLAAA